MGSRQFIRGVLAAVGLVAAGLSTTTSASASPGAPAPASAASDAATQVQPTATFGNTFERPASGTAYTRGEWAKDGWNAPWDHGMNSRSRIDSSVKRSGAQSLRVFYPQGQIGPENSGVSAPFTLPQAREYYVKQWIRFSPDFSWGTTQYGGKIGIGLGGGASCSGGQLCDGYNGFTSRFTWRSGGKAALYFYHMGKAGQYGDYLDLNVNGSTVSYPRGQWVEIVQRVKVNTVTNGNANPDGEIQAWYNGMSAGIVTGLRFVRNSDLVDQAYFSSFFGGATADFAPANDSYIWYDDVQVSTSPGAATVPVPWLKTVGNKIVTANTDQEVTLRGANVLRSEWDLNTNAERVGIPIMANQWKGNVVLRGFASDPVNNGNSQYLGMLDEHVSLAEANHLYVIFAWRSHVVDEQQQPTMPDDRAQQALVTLAQRYRGKPNVMYALQVEPHDVTWSQVQPRYVQMVDAIRAASSPYRPIIMVPGIDWSRDVSGAITNPVPRENVVYKSHPYNNQSQFQHQFIDTYNAGLPVFIGEFGYLPDGGMVMTDVNALLTVARQRNLGWTAWILDDETGNTALVTNRTTFDPTSPYGVAIKNEMMTTPPLPTDDGPPPTTINDTAFRYTGTWQTSSGSAKYLGDDHYSDVTNNAYQISFTGNQVKLYAATAPWHGNAAISIDGSPETTVDFYSLSRVDQALVYTSPPLATAAHTVTVRVTGTKNTNSTGTVVTADRADIITSPPLTINDNTTGTGPNQFQYTGNWSYATGSPSKYQGDDHYSNTTGATARITLTGTRIVLYGSKAPWHGIAGISIDGAAQTTVDYYAAARQDNVALYTSPPLATGSHTVTFTVTGTTNPAATDAVVTIDRIVASS